MRRAVRLPYNDVPSILVEPYLDGLSAANPDYLEQTAERIEKHVITGAVEDVVVFKKTNTRRIAVVLPGSYLNVRYLSDFVSGLTLLDSDIAGINYPGHSEATRIGNIDSLHLIDYSSAVYAFLLSLKDSYDEICLVGHSLGTIMVQLAVFIDYAFSLSHKGELCFPIRKIAVLGGGPPKLGLMDYAMTTLTRLHTMSTVMQMAKDPGLFISEKGDLKRTLGGNVVYEDFIRRRLIFAESRAVMKETFLGNDYAFVPSKIVKDMGIKALFAYAVNDYFVSGYSSAKAVRQWAAAPHALTVGHSGMVLGDDGRKLGAVCAEFLR